MTSDNNQVVMELPPYDREKRREEVFEQLSTKLDIAKSDLHKYGRELFNRPREDIFTISLNATSAEATLLKEQINKFSNPHKHYTKEYRTLYGQCGNLQRELDRFDVTGRDDLRRKRKDILADIEHMLKDMEKKVHSSGKLCPDCPVRDDLDK